MLDRLEALLDHFPISARLLDAGTISPDEYQRLKAKALA
mgnify:CR=1 FL=1